MAATLIGGVCYLYVDGTQYALRGNLNVGLQAFKTESVVGVDGYHGTKKMPVAPFIEAEVSDLSGLDISGVGLLSGVTINVKLANGKTGVLNNATQTEQISFDAVEGKYKIRFEGADGRWTS